MENRLEIDWSKILLRVFVVFAGGWTVLILAMNYDNYSNNRMEPPTNQKISQAIAYWKLHPASGSATQPNGNAAELNKGFPSGEDFPRITYDPLAMNVELYGYDGIVPPPRGVNRRIALPMKYAGRDDVETAREISLAFQEQERERKAGLVKKIVVHIVWPILCTGIAFYMAAWAIYGYRQSRKA